MYIRYYALSENNNSSVKENISMGKNVLIFYISGFVVDVNRNVF